MNALHFWVLEFWLLLNSCLASVTKGPEYRRGFVAGRDELLQSKLVEVEHKISEKIALIRIVAVAIHHLAAKDVRVEFQIRFDLLLNVGVLRVKLVVLCPLGTCEICVCHARSLHHSVGGDKRGDFPLR